MSFDDHLTARPTAQQTERCSLEQIQEARRVCEDYVRRRENGDVEALRDLVEMLGLQRTPAEIAGEDVDEEASEAS